jgi:hypothetical protein
MTAVPELAVVETPDFPAVFLAASKLLQIRVGAIIVPAHFHFQPIP